MKPTTKNNNNWRTGPYNANVLGTVSRIQNAKYLKDRSGPCQRSGRVCLSILNSEEGGMVGLLKRYSAESAQIVKTKLWKPFHTGLSMWETNTTVSRRVRYAYLYGRNVILTINNVILSGRDMGHFDLNRFTRDGDP